MAANSESSTSKPTGLLAQLSRFGMSGGIGAVVDYSSVLLFVALGVLPELARGLSFCCGSTTAYLLNRLWTFNSRRNAREVGLVASIYALTFLLVLAVNAIALRLLPDAWWTVTVAWVLSQGIGTTFNFVVQRILVFQR